LAPRHSRSDAEQNVLSSARRLQSCLSI